MQVARYAPTYPNRSNTQEIRYCKVLCSSQWWRLVQGSLSVGSWPTSPTGVIAREQICQHKLQFSVDLHCKVLLQCVAAAGTAEDLRFEGPLQTGLGGKWNLGLHALALRTSPSPVTTHSSPTSIPSLPIPSHHILQDRVRGVHHTLQMLCAHGVVTG